MVVDYVDCKKNTGGVLMENMFSISMFMPFLLIFKSIFLLFLALVGLVLFAFAAFIASFFVIYRVQPKTSADKLALLNVRNKWHDLLRWKLVDYQRRSLYRGYFPEFGFSLFVGKQGWGKTISLVEYLERMRKLYPECLIATNFKYEHSNFLMKDWHDFFEIRNGYKGVIFAIDEVHSEYSSTAWKDFPESLLSEISQQRKQRIKIVATSQVYGRVVKPMREQTFSVIECRTYFKRYTRCKEYDAFEYDGIDTPYVTKGKIKPVRVYDFIQSDYLRSCYDTYEKIKRLGKSSFIPRSERGTNLGGVISRVAN